MRTSFVVSLALLAAVILPPRLQGQEPQAQPQKNPAAVCGDESRGLPDFYYGAVLSYVEPPEWRHGLIKIVVGGDVKLALWTDGQKFKLWTDKPDISQKSIGLFLEDLDQACRLPPDPHDAFALLKISWESRDLSADQFAQLHRDFTKGLSQYGSEIQGRYPGMISKRAWVIHLDAIQHSVIYDNSYEHVELRVWEDTEKEADPMLKWVHEFRKLAETSFHRQIWRWSPPE